MARPEFFVLLEPDWSHGLETVAIPELPFTPDVVVTASAIGGVTFSGGTATVTTSAPHNLRVNMGVDITGVGGLTGINQPFRIASVPTTTTFTVPGIFSGAYTSGGTATPQETALTQTYELGVVFLEYDMLAEESLLGPIEPTGAAVCYAY